METPKTKEELHSIGVEIMNLNTDYDYKNKQKYMWEIDRVKAKRKCELVTEIGYLLAYDQDKLLKILNN